MHDTVELRVIRPLPGDRWSLDQGFLGEPERWLPDVPEPEGPAAWVVWLGVGPFRHSVSVEIGEAEATPEGFQRRVGWRPHGSRLAARALPRFDGVLVLRHVDSGLQFLVLQGVYEPPLDRPGALLDRALLHRVAEETAERFLEVVAGRLPADRATTAAGGEAP